MEQRLTKGMYLEGTQNRSTLFDIWNGQMREQRIVHNGGWYNRACEKLGWGDLNAGDLLRISHSLQKEEFFVVLPESSSTLGLGITGSMSPSERQTVIDYIATNCRYIIAQDVIYVPDRFESKQEETRIDRGVLMTRIPRDTVKQMLTA